MVRSGIVLALALVIILPAASRAQTPVDNNVYLDGLVGDWTMDGTVLGKPAKYTMHGERVLEAAFVRLSMVDVHRSAHYEADAYIGYDPHQKDFVAHWLDRYGAAGARVVGTGHREGSRLVLVFPYSEGNFRDTFVFNPGTKSWALLMETQAKNGTWSQFANYAIARR